MVMKRAESTMVLDVQGMPRKKQLPYSIFYNRNSFSRNVIIKRQKKVRNVQYRNFPPNEFSRNNPYAPVSSTINQHNERQELTPYELFSKPELPTQYLMSQQQIQSQPGAGAGGTNENNPFNFDTMISKVSQLASTYHQVSPIVKQFGTFVKGFM